jgi:hypothetical protein
MTSATTTTKAATKVTGAKAAELTERELERVAGGRGARGGYRGYRGGYRGYGYRG